MDIHVYRDIDTHIYIHTHDICYHVLGTAPPPPRPAPHPVTVCARVKVRGHICKNLKNLENLENLENSCISKYFEKELRQIEQKGPTHICIYDYRFTSNCLGSSITRV